MRKESIELVHIDVNSRASRRVESYSERDQKLFWFVFWRGLPALSIQRSSGIKVGPTTNSQLWYLVAALLAATAAFVFQPWSYWFYLAEIGAILIGVSHAIGVRLERSRISKRMRRTRLVAGSTAGHDYGDDYLHAGRETEIAVSTKLKTKLLEFYLERDFDSFTYADAHEIVNAIRQLLSVDQLDVVGMRRGSVILSATTTPYFADQIVKAVKIDGTFLYLDLVDVQIVEQDEVKAKEQTAGQRIVIPRTNYTEFFKPLIDRFFSLIAVIVLAPVLLATFAIVKLSSRGPAFVQTRRVGRHGQLFTMLKFRTMRIDNDVLSKPDMWKMENDPRVTKVGYFLRKLSFDEMPQLINVLRGEMSLVGPRPLPVFEHEYLAELDIEALRIRQSVKPGMICMAQLSNLVLSFDEWMKSDVDYVKNQSVFLDSRLMLSAISAVVLGKRIGAGRFR